MLSCSHTTMTRKFKGGRARVHCREQRNPQTVFDPSRTEPLFNLWNRLRRTILKECSALPLFQAQSACGSSVWWPQDGFPCIGLGKWVLVFWHLGKSPLTKKSVLHLGSKVGHSKLQFSTRNLDDRHLGGRPDPHRSEASCLVLWSGRPSPSIRLGKPLPDAQESA